MYLNRLTLWRNGIFRGRKVRNRVWKFEGVGDNGQKTHDCWYNRWMFVTFEFGFNGCVWFRLWHFEMPLVLKSHPKLFALMLPNCSQMCPLHYSVLCSPVPLRPYEGFRLKGWILGKWLFWKCFLVIFPILFQSFQLQLLLIWSDLNM